ncbi:MAG: hypothetical protein P9L90_04295 [Candidatus Aadella gelida]|nr:hypothetical protein [Candidatus Aadella gelida]
MKVLKGILGESKKYYLDTKKKIIAKIANLPKGSVKERVFNGRKYYYLQERKGEKVVQKYLGKSKPEDLIKKIEERRLLRRELKKVNEALKIIKRAEGKKCD